MNIEIQQKFNVNIVGDGDQTLVLAHGFGSDQTAWRYQVEALKLEYRLVLFDYLGCGKANVSDYDPRHYHNLESYRDDVLAIYDALNLTDTIFVGHSVSAGIGMLVASANPKLIRNLVFISASPRYLNDGAYIGGFDQPALNTLYDTMASNYLGWTNGFGPLAIANAERPELGKEFANSLFAMRPDIAQSVARVIFEVDYREALKSIEQHVLILQTQHDIIVPTQAAAFLANHIPHNKLIMLNAEGHLPHLSAPLEVATAIQQYVMESIS